MAHVHGGAAGPKLQDAAVTDYTTGYLAAFGAMVALLRRARYGGSYLVRVSLSQTGMWVRKMGLMTHEQSAEAKPFQQSEISQWQTRSDTAFGPIRHLRPSVDLSLSPTGWDRPVVPLGTHTASWPRH